MKYEFSVNFDRLSLLSDNTGYTGNLETYDCGFAFSDEWKDFNKYITIVQGEETYTDKIDNDTYTLPDFPLGEICIGIFGVNPEGRRICTNFLVLNYEEGAYSTENPPIPTRDVWNEYIREMKESFSQAAEELDNSFKEFSDKILEEKVPQKASQQQATDGVDDTSFLTPLQGRNQFNHLITAALTNIPEVYIKESVDAMYEIASMKNGDMCLILSKDTTAQSVYRYYTHDIEGKDIKDTWVWMTDLSLFAPMAAIELKDGVWDYALGNSARITLLEDTSLNITNVHSGAYGVIDVYGKYSLSLPENSYLYPPDWNYLKPGAGQHFRYSFYYDGIKFDWNRSVRNDE